MAKERKTEPEPDEDPERVKVLHTMTKELKDWLHQERRKTGRSVSFMIELALKQWRDRIEKRRKYED